MHVVGVVFRRSRSPHSPRWIGSVNVNVEPAPSWLFTQIRSPWSSTNFRHRVNPSPVPSTFLAAVPSRYVTQRSMSGPHAHLVWKAGGSLADLNYWRRGGQSARGHSISPNCREMTESHCTMSRINQAPATGNRCFISRFSRWSPERTCQVVSQREPLDVAVLRLSTAREAAGKSPTTSGVGASGSRMAARYTEIWCDAEPAASLF